MSESMAARKGRHTKPPICSGSNQSNSLPSKSSPTTSFSRRTRSSLATTDLSSNKQDANTVAIATMAMAALSIVLGGTYQREHRRKLQEQENGTGNEEVVTSTISRSRTALAPMETQVAPSLSPILSNYTDVVSPFSQNLLVDIIAGIKSNLAPTSDAISSHMEPLRRQAVKNPISSQFHQPRNVMISRMRSIKGRGLNEKYKVDWNTVLGEGAYGSVHPARLALTGEKVALKKISKRYTNSSDFFSETDALLRIYDNGGHPNISGLRDMVSLHSS